jgi:hypothetical protein
VNTITAMKSDGDIPRTTRIGVNIVRSIAT